MKRKTKTFKKISNACLYLTYHVPGPSLAHKAFLILLGSMVNNEAKCHPSYKFIQESLCMSRSQVTRVKNYWKEVGVLDWVKGHSGNRYKGGEANVYELKVDILKELVRAKLDAEYIPEPESRAAHPDEPSKDDSRAVQSESRTVHLDSRVVQSGSRAVRNGEPPTLVSTNL